MQVIFFVLSLHAPVWRLLRSVFWLVAWVLILQAANDRSRNCNNLSGSDRNSLDCKNRFAFDSVYTIVIKIVAALCVYCGSTVVREAVVKWLSLRFHHRQQLKQMTVCSGFIYWGGS